VRRGKRRTGRQQSMDPDPRRTVGVYDRPERSRAVFHILLAIVALILVALLALWLT
jgi:hypothetical protein